MKAEVLKGQHKIVFKGLFASEVHQVWKMTENLGACYGVREGARKPVKDLFTLLTRSSVEEDIRSVISWGGDNASFIVHNFTKFHNLVTELYGKSKTAWLKSWNDYVSCQLAAFYLFFYEKKFLKCIICPTGVLQGE